MNDLHGNYDKLKGSLLACIGFVLSPLSWWNDPYVNMPIAYFCAWLASIFYPQAFLATFAGAYLATNLLGLILLHRGISKTLAKPVTGEVRYAGKNVMKDLAVSLFYTAVMVILVKLNVIRPVQDYFR